MGYCTTSAPTNGADKKIDMRAALRSTADA